MPLDNRTCFQVNLRDRLACRLCGIAPQAEENYHRGFEYHHAIPKSNGGTDTADNILLLCHACHETHHRIPNDAMPEAGAVPNNFECRACNALLQPDTVTMNCGWYKCDQCLQTTHLWTHFFQT